MLSGPTAFVTTKFNIPYSYYVILIIVTPDYFRGELVHELAQKTSLLETEDWFVDNTGSDYVSADVLARSSRTLLIVLY